MSQFLANFLSMCFKLVIAVYPQAQQFDSLHLLLATWECERKLFALASEIDELTFLLQPSVFTNSGKSLMELKNSEIGLTPCSSSLKPMNSTSF